MKEDETTLKVVFESFSFPLKEFLSLVMFPFPTKKKKCIQQITKERSDERSNASFRILSFSSIGI